MAKRRIPFPALQPAYAAPSEPKAPEAAPVEQTPAKRQWRHPPGHLFTDHTTRWEVTCFVCGRKIPANEPHQFRHMAVMHACSGCPYPKEAATYH
jgi:hypothetical protein